jgi:hypothetical protein
MKPAVINGLPHTTHAWRLQLARRRDEQRILASCHIAVQVTHCFSCRDVRRLSRWCVARARSSCTFPSCNVDDDASSRQAGAAATEQQHQPCNVEQCTRRACGRHPCRMSSTCWQRTHNWLHCPSSKPHAVNTSSRAAAATQPHWDAADLCCQLIFAVTVQGLVWPPDSPSVPKQLYVQLLLAAAHLCCQLILE